MIRCFNEHNSKHFFLSIDLKPTTVLRPYQVPHVQMNVLDLRSETKV